MKNSNKILFLIMAFFLFTIYINAQKQPIEYLVFKIQIKDDEYNLSQFLKSKLEDRIIQIASNYGFSANDTEHDFNLIVNSHIYDSNILTGLRKTVSVNGELFLHIENKLSGIQFKAITIPISGTGNNEELATSDAIKNINTKNTNLNNFFTEAKSKIFEFYNFNCENYLSRIKKKSIINDNVSTINLLLSIPPEASSCNTQIEELLIRSFLNLQNNKCNKLLLKAKGEASIKNYKEVVNTISFIDPESNCYKEALILLEECKAEVENTIQQEINIMLKRNEDIKELELQRLYVIKEIGVAKYTDERPYYQDKNIELLIVK